MSTDQEFEELLALRSHFDRQEYGEAELLAKELIGKYPDLGLPRKLLGLTLRHLGRVDEALAAHKATAHTYSEDYEAHCNLAAEYQLQGIQDEAAASYGRAIELQPDNPNAYCELGEVFTTIGLLAKAEACCRQAVDLQPDMAVAHHNLGKALHAQGKYTESIGSYRQALAFKPNWAEAYNNLAISMMDQGNSCEAQINFREAMQLKPDWAAAHSNFLYCLSLDVQTTPDQLHAEHVAFGEKFEAVLRKKRQPHTNNLDPARVIHVGFVSGDLHEHGLANFLEPVFECLAAKADLVLHAYCNHICNDSVDKRMRHSFAHWLCVTELTDDALADRIRADGIDILFDLSGHTAHNRLLALARKPAPIQVSWLGYFGTSGLDAMDYYLCDKFWVPPGVLDWQFTEKPLYLSSAVTFQPDPLSPQVNELPALHKNSFTFGSFDGVKKINESVLVLWAMLMSSVPKSTLLLGAIEPESQAVLLDIFKREGISPDRIAFVPQGDNIQYLTLHHQVDLCLDTFPHSSGATTAHAAWMGVPTLCMAGETPASRFSASLMHHLKLDNFVATSIEDYIEIAVHWSQHTAELSKLRAGLRAQFISSPLGQVESFADQLGATLQGIWREWCEERASTNPTATKDLVDSNAKIEEPLISPKDATQEYSDSANFVGLQTGITDLATAIPALMQLASSNNAAGQLLAAKVLYLEVVKIVPKHDLANHNLGVVEGKLNGAGQALPWLETAVQENPQCEQYWISYINALMQSGAVETAVSAIEWGQKYGLKSETAQAMATDFVAALERMRGSPQPPPDVILDEFPDASPAPDWPSPRLSQSADLSYIHAPKSSGRRYVIFAPLYRHNSAGIRVMFELQKWLILAGYDAIVIAGTKEYALAQFADDIIVYPEVVTGNPLKAKRVVRYILNVPGKLSGTKTYAKHELLVAYSAALAEYAGGNVLQTPSIESIFYSDGRVKTANAVYVGKAQDLKLHPADCVYITGSFPATRFEVAEFMRSVKTLYTYDSFSVIAHEAMECGCDVKLIDKDGTIGAFPDPCHTPITEFKEQLHDFIQISQSL